MGFGSLKTVSTISDEAAEVPKPSPRSTNPTTTAALTGMHQRRTVAHINRLFIKLPASSGALRHDGDEQCWFGRCQP
ncbi:hypothetical protein AB0H36_32545 [Kribbella sp. NPDC050820]|uniref:hypothetical protein n=1 Tax=Kribbella sp. NPDC050820 TaxID=3155408 RepID=UPI0033D48077